MWWEFPSRDLARAPRVAVAGPCLSGISCRQHAVALGRTWPQRPEGQDGGKRLQREHERLPEGGRPGSSTATRRSRQGRNRSPAVPARLATAAPGGIRNTTERLQSPAFLTTFAPGQRRSRSRIHRPPSRRRRSRSRRSARAPHRPQGEPGCELAHGHPPAGGARANVSFSSTESRCAALRLDTWEGRGLGEDVQPDVEIPAGVPTGFWLVSSKRHRTSSRLWKIAVGGKPRAAPVAMFRAAST